MMKLPRMSLLVLGLMTAMPLFGIETLDVWDAYKDHLTAKHVTGNASDAHAALANARSKTRDDSSELAKFLSDDIANGIKADDPGLRRAILFLTGTKQETYCHNVGLVEINAQHKDGTQSHVVLGNQHREMDGSYAWVKEGAWTYELTNGYRPTMRSDLWIVFTGENSYRIKERRDQRSGEELDTGDYKASWSADGSRISNSFKSRGETFEPFPMYMANDFHIWGGNPTLGRLIKFEVGFERFQNAIRENGFGYKILLKSKQTVAKHLDQISVVDGSGVANSYTDCFRVDYDIQFDGLAKK